MLKLPSKGTPNGLNADQDAAALMRKLAASLFGVSVALAIALVLTGQVVRPAVMVGLVVGFAM